MTENNAKSDSAPSEEKQKIHEFFPRTILDIETGVPKKLDDFLRKEPTGEIDKLWGIPLPGEDLYQHFIKETNNAFGGIWITGEEHDGITRLAKHLAERYQKQEKNKSSTSVHLLSGDANNSRILTDFESLLINEKTIIKCAQKAGLIDKASWWRSIPAVVVTFGLGSVFTIINMLFIQSATLSSQVVAGVFLLLGFVIAYFPIKAANNRKSRDELLQKLDKDTNFNPEKGACGEFIDLLLGELRTHDTPRVVIIDDFSAFCPVSQAVLRKYCEKQADVANGTPKNFWIFLDIDREAALNSQNWGCDKKFTRGKLLPLTWAEKKELIGILKNLPGNEGRNFDKIVQHDLIKDICDSGDSSKETIGKAEAELERLRKEEAETFAFLCFIASNNFPLDLTFSESWMKEKISRPTGKDDVRKWNDYLPMILGKNGFSDREVTDKLERIRQSYLVNEGNRYRVRSALVQAVVDNHLKPAYRDIYRYGNGYWGMCLYLTHLSGKQWKVGWTRKLEHHLTEGCLLEEDKPLRKTRRAQAQRRAGLLLEEDKPLREHWCDAYLLTIEKNIRYLRRGEAEKMIERAFENPRLFPFTVEQRQRLIVCSGTAYLDFNSDFAPIKKDVSGDYAAFHDFLATEDIALAKQLVANPKFAFLMDVTMHVLLERCWERMLFLLVSDKNIQLKHAPKEVEELMEIFKQHIPFTDLQKANDWEAMQKVRNLALWIWILTLEFVYKKTRGDNEKALDEIITSVENLAKAFADYGNKCQNYRNDLEKTLLYMTMQEAAYIIIASLLLINKGTISISEECSSVLSVLGKIFQVSIPGASSGALRTPATDSVALTNAASCGVLDPKRIKNDEYTFDGIMRLISLHSLTWKCHDYRKRYCTLTNIRTQLYCLWAGGKADGAFNIPIADYTEADEQNYKFKEELENIAPGSRQTIMANLSLCMLYLGYAAEMRSHYFSKARIFSDSRKSVGIQIEYAFMYLVRYFHDPDSDNLLSALDFLNNHKGHKEDILSYLSCAVSTAYLHLRNTLRLVKNNDSIDYFTSLLAELKEKNAKDIEDSKNKNLLDNPAIPLEKLKCKMDIEAAEAILEELRFSRLSRAEQLKSKTACEQYWINRGHMNICSTALCQLLDLDSASTELKDRVHMRLTKTITNYNDYSGHLLLAGKYLEKTNTQKDNKHKAVLAIAENHIDTWGFKENLGIAKEIYGILFACTGKKKYRDALVKINIKLSVGMRDNASTCAAFDYFCHLCQIWSFSIIARHVGTPDSDRENIIKQDKSMKEFLMSHKHTTPFADATSVNADFLLINECLSKLESLGNTTRQEFEQLISECNEEAEKGLSRLIDLIVEANKDHSEQILRLKEEWDKQVKLGDED